MTPWWSKPTSDAAQEKSQGESSKSPQAGVSEEPEKKETQPAKAETQKNERASAPKDRDGESRPEAKKPRQPKPRARKPRRSVTAAKAEADPKADAAPRGGGGSGPKAEGDEARGGARDKDPLASRTRRSRSSRRRSARTPRTEEVSEERESRTSEAPTASAEAEKNLALFCEVSSLLSEAPGDSVDVRRIVGRLLEKGRIVSKRAYGDWERFSQWKKPFHMAGFQLVEVPADAESDLRVQLAVDAMEQISGDGPLVDCFVLISGDHSFVPLVSSLRSHRRQVIGLGRKDQASELLVESCDEFLFYDELPSGSFALATGSSFSDQEQEAFAYLADAVLALIRENKDVLWGSMVKQTIQRKHPSFNEASYGYSTFSDLLQDAEQKKLIQLRRDERSGSFIVTDFVQSQ